MSPRRVATALVFGCIIAPPAPGNPLPEGKPYPAFQVGVTGIFAKIDAERIVSVDQVRPDTPTDAKSLPMMTDQLGQDAAPGVA